MDIWSIALKIFEKDLWKVLQKRLLNNEVKECVIT